MNQKSIHLFRVAKIMAALFLTYLVIPKVRAQIPASSYGFTSVSGTFTEITGTAFTAVQSDDVLPTATIPIGFTFNYCGADYTTIRAGSNGYMAFLGSSSQTAFNDLSSLGTIKPALFWLWDDLDGATGTAHYTTTGSAPNRVFIFQFKNWEWNWSAAGPNVSVQVKLYETTNVIEYVYRQESQPGNPSGSGGASIGICDNAGTPTYLSLNNASATPTASSTAFTTNISGKPANGQIYRFTPPESCATSTATFPTAGTTAVSPGNVCVSGNVTLNFTPTTAFPPVTGISYKWQIASVAAGPYTDIPGAITTLPTYVTTTPITANSFFRCVVLCNTSATILTSSASTQVVVNNPGNPASTTPAGRCGPGVVNLNATPPAGATINWYANATGGAPLVTGSNSFTTPYLPTTTTFYAAAASGSSPASGWIGTGTLTTTNPNPFATGWWAQKSQFLITATEMLAAGFGSGTINSIGFDVVANGGLAINGFYIKLATTNLTALTGITDLTALPTNYTSPAVFTPTVGVNTYNLTAPFVWDGSSNILVETCLNNSSWGATHSVRATTTTFTSSYVTFNDVANFCNNWSSGINSSFTSRPNMQFGMTLGCTGPRVPVIATINPSTVVPRTSPEVVCNNGVATIALTPPAAPNNYPSYNWSPQTELFTNAAATIPYTGGSATTVYMKSPTVGVHTYYMMAGNPNVTTGCTYADTVKIHVQPGNILIKGQPDTLCAPGGSSTLKLDTIAGYYAGTIQWQSSIDGINYSNIAGANSSTFITPTLTFGNNTYYKAVITAGSTVCETPVKYMVVANPTLTGTTDSFNCGPGTVTLKATTGGNGSARWYDVPTLGISLGTGSEFVTPFLTQTDTFYVESAAGGSSTPPTFIGTGTTASTNPNPFATGWWAQKSQFLIRATEMAAAGFGAGNITELALDVVSNAGLPINGFYIKLTNSPLAALAGITNLTALPNNYTAPGVFTPVANSINNFVLNVPFVWDGTSNILIETCLNNSAWGTSHSVRTSTTAFTSSYVTFNDVANFCGNWSSGINSSYSSRPNFRFTMQGGCKSPRQPVIAYIHPFPTVNLGGNINQCVDPGSAIVLDAGLQQYSPSFVWDNGPGQQVRAVNTSGIYYVTATNLYGCTSSDTVQVTLRNNPIVELGNDTSVCNGVVLPLNAGTDGISYFWNTGATTSTINVNSPGTYNVFVTNAEGCTKTDTITVTMQGQLPSHNGIQITNNGVDTFHFSAMNPQNVIGYEWDFGDNSPFAYSQNPKHKYLNSGNYIVTLKLSSTCGEIVDTTTVHILGLGVDDVNAKIQLVLYPNPTSDKLTIEAKNNVLLEGIQVYNILGQLMQTEVVHQSKKHELSLSGLSNGMYTIKVQTDKGSVTRKIDLVR